jgi:hypothetical protein
MIFLDQIPWTGVYVLRLTECCWHGKGASTHAPVTSKLKIGTPLRKVPSIHPTTCIHLYGVKMMVAKVLEEVFWSKRADPLFVWLRWLNRDDRYRSGGIFLDMITDILGTQSTISELVAFPTTICEYCLLEVKRFTEGLLVVPHESS